MDLLTSLSIVAFAGLIHASFQLSVGVMSLLSGHALSAKKSRARIRRLTTSYMLGAATMTLLLLSFISLIFLTLFGSQVPLVAWALVCGVGLGIGLAVWLFYYRRHGNGAELWIPRSFAEHLHKRSKATQNSAEAFSLGLTSVVAELLFIIPSLSIAALVLLELPGAWQLGGIALYTVLSVSGLLLAWSLIGGGRSLARVQRWRTDNKRFIQFAAGGALMVLGFFVYVSKIIATMSGAL